MSIIKGMSFEKRLQFFDSLVNSPKNEATLTPQRQVSSPETLSKEYSTASESSSIRLVDISSYKHEYKKMINEILCERPYALYSFFMNLDKNPYYFRKAYHRIES